MASGAKRQQGVTAAAEDKVVSPRTRRDLCKTTVTPVRTPSFRRKPESRVGGHERRNPATVRTQSKKANRQGKNFNTPITNVACANKPINNSFVISERTAWKPAFSSPLNASVSAFLATCSYPPSSRENLFSTDEFISSTSANKPIVKEVFTATIQRRRPT